MDAATPTSEQIGDRLVSGPFNESGMDAFPFWLVTSADGRTLIGRCYTLEAARELASAEGLLRAVQAWAETYPDKGDLHDNHIRGYFTPNGCPGCRAELALLRLVEKLPNAPAPTPKRMCDWYPKCRNEALEGDIFCAEHRRQEDALPTVDPAEEHRGAP
jgi:hypothetical protein